MDKLKDLLTLPNYSTVVNVFLWGTPLGLVYNYHHFHKHTNQMLFRPSPFPKKHTRKRCSTPVAVHLLNNTLVHLILDSYWSIFCKNVSLKSAKTTTSTGVSYFFWATNGQSHFSLWADNIGLGVSVAESSLVCCILHVVCDLCTTVRLVK